MGCDGHDMHGHDRIQRFQSTYPVWDATTRRLEGDAVTKFQSTHPVWDATKTFPPFRVIYRFQSTHPVWDATFCRQRPSTRYRYFNPRIPYGMRQSGVNKWTKAVSISIHASRMGCDMRRHPAPFGCRNFNPRIPYGMRRVRHVRFQGAVISIHASRMGCDHLQG